MGMTRAYINDALRRLPTQPNGRGAGLAVAYDDHPALASYKNILIVVSGGATTSIERIRTWAATL